MATLPTQEIVPATQLGSSATTLYTSPLSTATRIEKVTYTNTDSASHAVTVYLVPYGSTSGSGNQITIAQAVRPSDTLNDVNLPGHYMNPGDSLAAYADAPNFINIFVAGTQFT